MLVTFVGENFIGVKKFIPDGHGLGVLEDVAPPLTFDAKILDCKALGNETPLGFEYHDCQPEPNASSSSVSPGWPFRVLVLLLNTRRVLFVFADPDDDFPYRPNSFKAHFTLPAAPHPSFEYNRQLAVDPL